MTQMLPKLLNSLNALMCSALDRLGNGYFFHELCKYLGSDGTVNGQRTLPTKRGIKATLSASPNMHIPKTYVKCYYQQKPLFSGLPNLEIVLLVFICLVDTDTYHVTSHWL